MAVLRSPLFIICSLLFVLHQLSQKVLRIPLPLADAYLDNLVAMPVILNLLLAERRYFFKKGDNYFLPLIDIFMATLYVVFITEIVFPIITEKFTRDWMDVMLYAIGSIIFYITMRHKKREPPSSLLQ